jgi:hypothetical protein
MNFIYTVSSGRLDHIFAAALIGPDSSTGIAIPFAGI